MKKTNSNHMGFSRCSPKAKGALLLVGLLWALGLQAQSPTEHASHHPGQADGGGMEGMGEMMENMGKPPPKELYPSLMALPELTPEQRKQVEAHAAERMHAGTMLMGQALDSLNAGMQSGDYAAMHEAMTRLREGAVQLESGISARRAVAEGRAPRAVASAWFKQEMNLPPATTPATKQGATPFHLFTMVLLVAFALAMIAMYFLKMRRAAALFGRIEADKAWPPPGSAPPLAGGKPAGGQMAGDKPAAAPEKPVAV